MADKFDRFTERARHVLALAQEEAQRLNHAYIGTEHLLLGLLRESEGVAARALDTFGVQLPRVRSGIEYIVGQGEAAISSDLGLTPRAKRAIELAVKEARRLRHDYVGTEHLLLGLLREGEGVAASVLDTLGVNLKQARSQIEHLIAEGERAAQGARGRGPGLGLFVVGLGIGAAIIYILRQLGRSEQAWEPGQLAEQP